MLQVLLVSAQDALLAKLILSKRETPEELARFVKLEFGRCSGQTLPRGKIEAAALERLAASGLPLLEEKVCPALPKSLGNSVIMRLSLLISLSLPPSPPPPPPLPPGGGGPLMYIC